ncbi:GH3 auxin-responsive promoter family protein [Tuwongella immobilis]|uniref:GH3 auxin-responsive promoter n=1 Tax=Tuwongella immobilis TaxID=692036 RepID=A0A6C2YHH9_9BACT|nr:GH3 auxin-responsive promoter family protein [Tuwongella immobilis]VIP00593.1 GH3 auxin-responsive promoter OS=Planctomyces limnophilus (strain ATCC 43296 / DSM 3776 / IFAM 1008 / 290) GN=Plim_0953 PE=4 SV=1: GH3 [Tuwongella immobilis]VTR96604.1 GH3 auxin-responsive promoter OS=Planctomyces limnophilus (strain ATCC 43296 / DSM 3776 / IFAM 1008 / 290) GN=Plim_0953 PE=4 SV=1: GH3 [Tuwongella immobilis]
MMATIIRILGKIVARPIRRRLFAFLDATQDPQAVQTALLHKILAHQAQTGFGIDHGFDKIQSIDDYRRQVPIGPYEYHAPYIERVKKGDIRALIADPIVHMFALTSGTTASRKLIPITPSYLAAYRHGWNIWGLKSFRDHRPITMRPIVQLVGDPEEYRTEAGIPCGNLSGLTAQIQKRIVRWLYLVPPITGRIKDPSTRYYVALRFSIRKQIGMLLSANPSTMVTLARMMETHQESLIRDLFDGTLSAKLDLPSDIRASLSARLKKNPDRARELEKAASAAGALRPSGVWLPDRTLIGTWTGGSVGAYIKQLPKYYGDTPIRDLGLLASEGRMTLPMDDATPSGVLDITSHYFEFVPEGEIDSPQPTVLGAHELQEGQSYYILPTTSAGLYRYHIVDLVRCTGFLNRTPLIEFLGKGNRFANVTGEKLSEHQVVQAMATVLQRHAQPVSAYTLAPIFQETQSYYGIFLEQADVSDPARTAAFLRLLDHQLAVLNIEYAAKRESGRLGPVRALIMPNGTWPKWDLERLQKSGGSPEQYKRPCLIGDLEFRSKMPVESEILPAAESLQI